MTDHIGADLLETIQVYNAALLRALGDRVSLADADVLELVSTMGAMTAIASARGVTKQAIQGQVQSLVRRHYVVLKPDPNDARAKCVVLTSSGISLVAQYAQAKLALHAAVEAKLGPERLKNMGNMLSQTRAAVTP